jgi:nickel transport protein
MSRRALASAALAAALLAPLAARAHEVLHEVERGRAIAVRASYADGEVLAYAQYEVFSPADRELPHQKGRTDRSGWLAFVPDAPGRWRVRVIDTTGHGLDVEVDADAPGAGPSTGTPAGAGSGAAGSPLRLLLGLATIAVVFASLWLFQRRRGTRP